MKRRIPCVVAVALAVVVLGLPLTATPAFANSPIVVTTTADVVNTGDGLVSLREAVTKANTDAGADTIQLDDGETYGLTICDGVAWPYDSANLNGDLNISDEDGLSIEGHDGTIDQQCDEASQERVVTASDGALSLAHLTLTGGTAEVNAGYGAGALLIFQAPLLELDHVTVRDNTATDEANLFHRDGAAISVQLTPAVIQDSEIRDNTGMGAVSSSYDRVDVSRTTITGNSYPGGIAAGIYGRTVEITESTISDNSVTGGSIDRPGVGGVLADTKLMVRRSTFEHNHGSYSGAVVSADGLLEDSILTDNTSDLNHGAALFAGTVRRTIIAGNEAHGTGGGGHFEGVIEDSTISDNSASTGGGISYGQLTVRRSTVAGNTADIGAGMAPVTSSGSPAPSLHLEDATIAGNVASQNGPGALPAEISLVSGTTSAPAPLESSRSVVGDGTIPACNAPQPNASLHGYNLWSDDSCVTTVSPVDLPPGDPKLGPLQNNGGPTPTRLPLPGSPLRDRIPLSNPACAGNDQRGVSRPQGLGCDIGATEVAVPPSGFVGMAPKRILDTRTSMVPNGWPAGAKLDGPWLDLVVAGTNGVPADATSVVLNVTSTEATSALTYVAAWPSGWLPPQTSSLNLQPGANVANSITVAPGVDGKVMFAVSIGATHLVVDVLGYYKPTGGDRFTGVTPIRMLDTRYGPVPAPRPVGQKLSGPGTIHLPVAGVNGVPADVTSVVANITSTQASSDLAFLTAWPTGQTRPTASNLNLQPAYNVSNLAFVKVGTGGTIDLYTNAGSTHLIVDVVGYFRPSTGDKFLPLNPTRLFDSRTGTPLNAVTPAWAQVADTGGVPSNATSVVLNATSTQASSPGGYLIVFGKGAVLSNDTGSNLNYRPPYNAPNQVISPVGQDHSVGLWNGYGTVHIVLDANGYFVTPAP